MPLVAAGFLIRSCYYVSGYLEAIGNTNRLEREGRIVAVPISEEPRYNDFRKQWVCRLSLPGGGTMDYLREEKPAGVKELYFCEHPGITGSISFPNVEYEVGGLKQIIVEVSSAKPEWDELFAGLTGSTFMVKTAWLSTLIVATGMLVWLAWKSYWWMKGGRKRRRRHHPNGQCRRSEFC